MASFNKVIMIGNLTRDPELRALPTGTPVVEFGLASTRRYNSQNSGQREQTCFIDVRFYGRLAEVIHTYLKKGRPVLVEGRLEYASWTGQDGTKRSKHRIIGENFQFLGSRQNDRDDSQGRARRETPPPSASPEPPPAGDETYPSPPEEPDQGYFAGENGEDSIPF